MRYGKWRDIVGSWVCEPVVQKRYQVGNINLRVADKTMGQDEIIKGI